MDNQIVSIITPVFNAAETILETVDSVLHQSYPNWELILVDDCSSDESWQIVQRCKEKDRRIQSFRLEGNSGAARARNLAIEHARGRFIAFLDADDLWLPEKLTRQVDFSLNRGAAVTHTSYAWIDQQGIPTGKVIHARETLRYRDMLDYNYIGCLTAMYDRDVVGKKFYMPEIDRRQDYALWLSIMRSGFEAFGLDEVLAHYRTGSASLSSNKMQSALYNIKVLRQLEGLGWGRTLYHFSRYALRGFIKYKS